MKTLLIDIKIQGSIHDYELNLDNKKLIHFSKLFIHLNQANI